MIYETEASDPGISIKLIVTQNSAFVQICYAGNVIKALIFDYFGVISSNDYWGYTGSTEGDGGVFDNLARDVNIGKLDWESFCRKVAEAKGVSKTDVEKLYREHHLNRELVAFIESLKPQFKIVLLTNASSGYVPRVLEQTHLNTIFDEIFISSDTGALKPQPRAYEMVLTRLKILPQEAVLIDDSPHDVDGAEAVGMATILYQDFETFKAQFNSFI
jgi:HAD superfamily hydrolase (TIGR01509 family)